MSTVNPSTKQGAAGSRLAQMSIYIKMLSQKNTYVNVFKTGVITAVSILSVVTLYWVILAVRIRNTIKSLRGRGTPKAAFRKTPPSEPEPVAKPVEDVGINMDDVQEIPGEGELAAMKEAMPERDQIPEIDDEPQVDSSDEREPFHVTSDDESTVIGQDELVGVKGSPVVVPVIKYDFERPISPPATPPTETSDSKVPAIDAVDILQANSVSDAPTIANVVSNETFVIRESSARNSTIEEAAKAVEEHAKFVEDATSPTDSTIASSKHDIDSPISEFVVVSDAEEKPIESVPAPIESSQTVVEEAEGKPPVIAEPATVEAPVLEVPAPIELSVEPEQVPAVVEEPKIDAPAPVIEEPEAVEEPKEEPKAIEEQVVAEPEVVEGPEVIGESESAEAITPEGSPKAAFPSLAKPTREDPAAPAPSKSLIGRPRVMRRATGSTPAVAGITTSPAPATVAVVPAVEEKTNARSPIARRADDALNRLASSILRSNTSERLPSRPTSPVPSAIPRAVSPPPRTSSPSNAMRSESPSRDAGAGSRPTSPTFGMGRRGSVSIPRPPSRQSTLANVTNAPERSSPPVKKTTFATHSRGGSVSPPPLPLPPQFQGSQGPVSPRQGSVRGSPSPQVPQAAVMSPSVLSRKATIDSNGSPGSPPNGRRARSPSPARSPVDESAIGQAARRNLPFPSPVENQPVASPTAVKPQFRPRTSTSGSTKSRMAPNTLLATLTSKVTFPSSSNSGSNPVSPGPISPASAASPVSPASPNRSDSIASAVSNRSSIYSFSDMSDMDVSTSDLDFAGRESHRMVLNGARYDSIGSITSSDGMSDGGMSGNEEEKQKKRAKRRAKARAQALQKQKRSKRN